MKQSEKTMQLRITFESDWHIGTGTGIPGSVDRVVLRDHGEFPYVSGKTLTGMLRDAAEMVAEQLDAHRKNVYWKGVLNDLFGPHQEIKSEESQECFAPARIGIRSAAFSSDLKAALKGNDKAALRQALTFLKPGVKINPVTGRAEDKKLFFTEMVRQGCVLEAPVELRESDMPLSEAECALLAAAAAALRRLGGKRRRGSGKVKVEIEGLEKDGKSWEQSVWLAWLEENFQNWNGERGKQADNHPAPVALKFANPTGKWRRVRCAIRLDGPVVVPLQVRGNVVRTRTFLPGTLVLQALAPRLKEALGTDLMPLVQCGRVILTPFTRNIGGAPSLPIPLCLAGEGKGKAKEGPLKDVVNLLRDTEVGQVKPLRVGWISDSCSQHPYYKKDDKIVGLATHNTVLDKDQRPTEEVGGVYSYEYLKPGTEFVGDLFIAESLSPKEMNWKEPQPISLGLSRKDMYGQATIKVLDSKKVHSPSNEPEKEVKPDNKGHLVVWLCSDTLIRDKWNRLTGKAEDFVKTLETHLRKETGKNLTLELVTESSGQGEAALACRGVRVESWQGKWGLPRPSLVGLQGGSVLTIQVEGWTPAIEEKARLLEITGFGERTGEGYGRIRFNPPVLTKDWEGTANDEPPSHFPSDGNASPELTADEKKLLKTLKLEAGKTALTRLIHRIVAQESKERVKWLHERLGFKINTRKDDLDLSNAQLGTLRSMAETLTSWEKRERFMAWLGYQVGDDGGIQFTGPEDPWPERRRDTWGLARKKLLALVSTEDLIWNILSGHSLAEEIKQDLWAFAVRTLLQVTAAELSKEK